MRMNSLVMSAAATLAVLGGKIQDDPPRQFTLTNDNKHIAARIGIKINGIDVGHSLTAYDQDRDMARHTSGRIIYGKIEPFWREPQQQQVITYTEPKERKIPVGGGARERARRLARMAKENGENHE